MVFTLHHTSGTGCLLIHILNLRWGSGILSGNIWRNLSSMMPQREVSAQVCESSLVDSEMTLYMLVGMSLVALLIM